MNIHESVLNNNKLNLPSIMMPPKKRAPKSVASELLWGKSVSSNCGLLDSAKKSNSTKSASDSDEDNIIMAITEGRGEARCEIGMAVVNVSRPILVLCQTSDTQSYANTLAMLNIYNPNIVLYPATFEAKGSGNRLISEIAKYFPRIKLITIQRKGFNKDNGLETLYRICISESFALLIMIKNRYYALAACSGLLTYLENNLYIHYAKNCVKLDYQASDGFAIIDFATADRLELVSCNKPAQANKYSTLFGVMNRCLTRIGTRNLRSIILQPLFSAEKINERLDCVEELIKNPQVLAGIQLILPKLKNVDQLLSLSTLVPQDPQNCNNRQLNYVLLLNGILDTIDPLKEAIHDGQCPFYIHLNEIFNNKDFDFLKKFIR